MKRIIFLGAILMLVSDLGYAAPPDENTVRSCLQAQSVAHSVSIKILRTSEITQEDDYGDGFNANYIFKYRGGDAGYAEGRSDQALIYSGRLYRLSKALTLGDSHEIRPGEFNPNLAQWSIAKAGGQQYLCVSFTFDGLGKSGSFQSVHGGYMLNIKTKSLYFAVREVK
ncbi:hypothetical protein [Paraburkholderia sp. J76]|uniref:hypothetical protein n=1 Tax=Paraburkholderia sp. J76 TaxID=2805439 RepID=UPI002ABE1CAD|nr:hypothetical protein [Paraburkholderia sp. J76]